MLRSAKRRYPATCFGSSKSIGEIKRGTLGRVLTDLASASWSMMRGAIARSSSTFSFIRFAACSLALPATSFKPAITSASSASLLCCATNSPTNASTTISQPVLVRATIALVSLRSFGSHSATPSIATPTATAPSAHQSAQDHQAACTDNATMSVTVNPFAGAAPGLEKEWIKEAAGRESGLFKPAHRRRRTP